MLERPDDDAPEADAGDHELTTEEVVKAKVTLLMDTVVSPEKPIRIDPPEHPVDERVIQGSIKTFELPGRAGGRHVVPRLQQPPDRLPPRLDWRCSTGARGPRRALFQEYVKLKDFAGLDNGKDEPISTSRGSQPG